MEKGRNAPQASHEHKEKKEDDTVDQKVNQYYYSLFLFHDVWLMCD